ncbi:MAG TPA: hypothetical protein PKC72_10960 [Chitinophagaceae bacterium]|nr:hypothetical protein [Chitinophagaceae bacterium]
MDLSFLFWNTNSKKCLAEIHNLVTHYNIDVLILAENVATPSEMLLKLNAVSTEFYPNHPVSLCEKIKIYSRFHHDFIAPIEESQRLSIRSIELPTLDNINLICLHFGDKGSFNPESQSEMASELRILINNLEEKIGHKRTLIVGDFNMNPFELGLIKANGLHATMSQKIARKGSRKIQSVEYDYFYNPMWSLYGDLNHRICGTYYYKRAELVNYQWNIFDQMLIRPDLLDHLDNNSVEILKHDGVKDLITKGGIPNKQLYSDHLPIKFKLTFKS